MTKQDKIKIVCWWQVSHNCQFVGTYRRALSYLQYLKNQRHVSVLSKPEYIEMDK